MESCSLPHIRGSALLVCVFGLVWFWCVPDETFEGVLQRGGRERVEFFGRLIRGFHDNMYGFPTGGWGGVCEKLRLE